MWLFVILVVLVCCLILVYAEAVKSGDFWRNRNIAYNKGLPFLGSVAPFVFGRKPTQELFKDLYDEFPDKRYSGIYVCSTPALLIRDPELIKQITIKDFDNFVDRSVFELDADTEPILSQNLVSLRGLKWRKMRSTLTPFFSSSKMKFMFALISDCAEKCTEYFDEQECNVIEAEMRNVCSRFTIDAIGATAFSMKVNSFKEKKNEFFVTGTSMCNCEGLNSIKFMIHAAFPGLMRFFNIPVAPQKFINYFGGILKENMKIRETTGMIYPDMIHLFMQAKSGKPNINPGDDILTDESIIAQAMIFFTAGFENTSTMMSFMSYELALNQDIQKKLQNEIDYTSKQCNGKVTYEALHGMKYLDMVISETLRRWPAGPVFDRVCCKDYVISPKLPGEKEIIVENGTAVYFPLAGLHHDPKYFSNPMKFDPERFNAENKVNLNQFAFIPFGVGPRNCIGLRFALMEMKIFFFHLLSKYDIVPTEKTAVPMTLTKFRLNLGSAKGFWMALSRRSTNN